MQHKPRAPHPNARPPLSIVTFTALVLIALGGHFSTVWLYLTPTNPLKIAMWDQVHGYMHPLFSQNWQLFAPNPISQDEFMLVKVNWEESSTKHRWESDWVDVTTPINQAIHTTRIGPFSKLARPYSTVTEMLNYVDPIAEAVREQAAHVVMEKMRSDMHARRRTDPKATMRPDTSLLIALDSVTRPTKPEETQRREGREMMYRIASAHAARLVGDQGKVLAVNVRFRTHEFPRFSGRHLPSTAGKTQFGRPFGWEKPRTDVALP